MGSLVVDDGEYDLFRESLGSFGAASSGCITAYNTLLDELNKNGIASGTAAKNLEAFAFQAKLMQGKAELLTQELITEMRTYIEDIDTADLELYRVD